VPSLALAATVYLPLLLTAPGRVGADTKTYLYLDPGRLLAGAPSMWDPGVGLGTVTHQNIGYLWPIGPYYWLADLLGVPDWVAQRFWTGTILVAAGLGVRFMLRTMGQEGPHVTAATFCYALTPYVLTLSARLSVILLPYAGLPWLLGLTVTALRHRRWREPAAFALVVATIGSVNATALILVGVAPILWILHEVVVTREATARQALGVTARIGLLTTVCSLWWLSGLWAQGSYGINILRYTETAETVATAAVSLEVLRGLGYWFFYGEDRFGPWIAPSVSYMRRIDLLVVTYLLPGLGLLGLAAARFRERFFFAVLLVVGVLLAVGAHPWNAPPPGGAALKLLLESEYGLAMRSLPRAGPLVSLAVAVFVGALLASATAEAARWARPATAGVVALAVLGLPPLWTLRLVDANLDRPEDIPTYWLEAAAFVDERDDGTRVLEVPGSDFASYRWGNTVDPILPGLIDRPYAARELIPYGSPASANLLDAFDHRMQEGTLDAAAIAPVARLLAAGDVSVRSDLTFERYNTPRPRLLWQLLTEAPGLSVVGAFGPGSPNRPRPELPMVDEAELQTPPDLSHPPEVGVLEVADAQPIVRTRPRSATVVLSGDGAGIVDAAAAGLLSGQELVLYSASYAADPDRLLNHLDATTPFVLTDTNRRDAQRWSTLRDNHGETERAGQEPLRDDAKDQRLPVFPDEDDRYRTVVESRGPVQASATSYGNIVTYTPEDRPSRAVDGQVGTAWRTGGFSHADGEVLRLDFAAPVTTDRIRLLQVIGAVRNRHITEVELRFDGDDPVRVALDESSRPVTATDATTSGQEVRFGSRTFSRLEIEITATDPGRRPRYDGLSAVGFAEVVVLDDDGTPLRSDDVVRLPTDLLDLVPSDDHPLAVVLTRQRTAGTVAVRTSPEGSMARTFDLPTPRAFAVSGTVRLSPEAVDDIILDRALGIPGADDGGVTATSRRRLPGGVDHRASAAIDGDLDTWYSPGFLGQDGEWLDFVSAERLRFDRFGLTVLNDGRHSVPRRIRLELDGAYDPELSFTLPEVADDPEPNATHTFEIPLPRTVEAERVRLVIEESPGAPEETVREVTTLDWYSGDEIVMPVGIAEVDIEGLRAATPPEVVSPECRTDLVEVDGRPVPVSLAGTTDDLASGRPVDLQGCDGGPLIVPAGSPTIRTAPGALTGFDLDQLVLRSGPGGAPDPGTGPLPTADAPDPDQGAVTVSSSDRTSYRLQVDARAEPTWLVLGQSHNLGWTATLDGRDLGPPELVDGYANGWVLPPGAAGEVRLVWTPQRVVDAALAVSALGVAVCLVLVLRRPRRLAPGVGAEPEWIPLDRRPSMPRPLAVDRLRRFAGPRPSPFALVATVSGAVLLGGALIGPLAGLVLGLSAALCLRAARARPLLTVGGPLLFAGSVGWVLVNQLFRELPSGFDWPTYFETVHQPTLLALGLLVLDPIIDRCWLRRWWPSEDSPT
jgi:arabinofuranan 3-O-arabinosyltransferase